MNKRQKEVIQSQLDDEQDVIDRLKEAYKDAKAEVRDKIRELENRKDHQNMQSIIYQKKYQEALMAQIDGALKLLEENEYATVDDYMRDCYESGYIGAMYDLAGQEVPFVFPIDQNQLIKAVQTDSQISQGLYKRLGEDVTQLKKDITAEVSRGIAAGLTWSQTAEYLARSMKTTPFNKAYNNAIRIARTEGHRIQQEAAMDTAREAKSYGADVAKQWDSTLDGRTRPAHRAADGQIKDIDEPFDVGGEKLMQPGDGSGSAWNVINCRCCMLQRARWALGGKSTKMDNFTKELREFNSPEDYEEFKKWYWSKENVDYMKYMQDMQKKYKTKNFDKLAKQMTDYEKEKYKKLEGASPMWKKDGRKKPSEQATERAAERAKEKAEKKAQKITAGATKSSAGKTSKAAEKAKKAVEKENKNSTMNMDLQYFARSSKDYKTVKLPKEEYVHVMSEFNTNMSDVQRQQKVVTKAIGNYVYTIENNGFDNYRIISKKTIEDVSGD